MSRRICISSKPCPASYKLSEQRSLASSMQVVSQKDSVTPPTLTNAFRMLDAVYMRTSPALGVQPSMPFR